MEDRIYLSVVIPTYNEESIIETTLNDITRWLTEERFASEIIVVDDGSSDKTKEVAERKLSERTMYTLVRNEKNRGKGYSVRRGMLLAKGDYVLFFDADLSVPMSEVKKLLASLRRGYDVAIGSRFLPESNIIVHQSSWREILGRVFNILVRLMVIPGLKDTQCGFKCFEKRVVRDIFERQTIEQMGFDVEILYIAHRLGYRVKEVPVTWANRSRATLRIVTYAVNMLFDLLRIRLRHSRTNLKTTAREQL